MKELKGFTDGTQKSNVKPLTAKELKKGIEKVEPKKKIRSQRNSYLEYFADGVIPRYTAEKKLFDITPRNSKKSLKTFKYITSKNE